MTAPRPKAIDCWLNPSFRAHDYKPDFLPIFSRDVLKRIPSDDPSWESMVPSEVCAMIKKRGFFGYQKDRARSPGPSQNG